MTALPRPVRSRRDLLTLIGRAAGGGAMLQAMTSLGLAAPSPYRGPVKLEGDPRGASVLILGAGLAGMTAAFELKAAGYEVRLLEYNDRAGGRNWTLRGGDRFTELGGATQECRFEPGLHFNPGPWRLPFHHHAILDYCRRFGVALAPFVQLNHNAYLHGEAAFGGRPQRIRHVLSDLRGGLAELLAKSTRRGALDEDLSREDREILLDALRSWGALDRGYAYKAGTAASEARGHARDGGGGVDSAPVDSEPIGLSDILTSRLWRGLDNFALYEFQTTLMEPVGGMDAIGKAFAARVGPLIRYRAKVREIRQDERSVTVDYEDLATGTVQTASASWCLCTIPLPILSQIPISVSARMKAAIDAVPYASSVKTGLQFRRRFWEEDEAIYGGITYTDLPITQIAYPNAGLNAGGKGILLGAYTWDGPASYEFTAMAPQERVRRAVEYGAMIHPQYRTEFEHGVSVAWHRVPFTLGCAGDWTEEARRAHYDDLCAIDGRILLAGEHVSHLPAWQEGAILSALDAITRLHRKVIAT